MNNENSDRFQSVDTVVNAVLVAALGLTGALLFVFQGAQALAA